MNTQGPVPGEYTRILTDDAGEHAARLGDFRQDYAQLSAGRYRGQLVQLRLPRLRVFRETRNQAVFERGSVEHGRVAIGLPGIASGKAWFCGAELDQAPRLLCTGADTEFLLRTPGGFDLVGLSLTEQEFDRALQARGVSQASSARIGSRALPASSAGLRQLREHCVLALQRAARGPCSPEPCWRDIEATLLDALAEAVSGALQVGVGMVARGNRERVVRQAIDYLHSNPDRPLSIDDLCASVGVSRRTLQYAFEQALAVNPARYFRLWRLNGVRRVLRRAAPREVQVADVACRWGFWHLPRFAGEYRALFGELPSTTLGSARH